MPAAARKTIGVFASQVGRAWGAEFIAGITAAAEANNVNLVHFIGGKLKPRVEAQYTSILLSIETSPGTY